MSQVRISQLNPGDFVVPWDTAVEEIWRDPEGLWITTSDGESGYVDRVARKVEILDY